MKVFHKIQLNTSNRQVHSLILWYSLNPKLALWWCS